MSTGRDLVLKRDIAVSPAKLYRCWTEPELIVQWFTPAPWTTVRAETDVRAGGASLIVMRSPEGVEFPNRGIYLEVVPGRRLVSTDAYTAAWEPSAKPFMTLVIEFDDDGNGGTRYSATARHWSVEDRQAHEQMGFNDGWGRATDQLAVIASRL